MNVSQVEVSDRNTFWTSLKEFKRFKDKGIKWPETSWPEKGRRNMTEWRTCRRTRKQELTEDLEILLYEVHSWTRSNELFTWIVVIYWNSSQYTTSHTETLEFFWRLEMITTIIILVNKEYWTDVQYY